MPNSSFTLRSLANQTVSIGGRINLELELRISGEQFMISAFLVIPQFLDDAIIFPHAADVCELDHFEGVHISVAPERGYGDFSMGSRTSYCWLFLRIVRALILRRRMIFSSDRGPS